MLTEQDLYYLHSIKRNLIEMRKELVKGSSLGDEVLSDNIDWLDCFIDKHERALVQQLVKPNAVS